MAIGRSGAKARGPLKARVSHGHCNVCYKDILVGQYYYPGVGGTNTQLQGKAHQSCYDPKPKGA